MTGSSPGPGQQDADMIQEQADREGQRLNQPGGVGSNAAERRGETEPKTSNAAPSTRRQPASAFIMGFLARLGLDAPTILAMLK